MKTVLIQITDADYAKLHAAQGPTTVTAISVVGRAEPARCAEDRTETVCPDENRLPR